MSHVLYALHARIQNENNLSSTSYNKLVFYSFIQRKLKAWGDNTIFFMPFAARPTGEENKQRTEVIMLKLILRWF